MADISDSIKELTVAGTVQQNVSSCLDVLEEFLLKDEIIVSSIVVVNKHKAENPEEVISNMLGKEDHLI